MAVAVLIANGYFLAIRIAKPFWKRHAILAVIDHGLIADRLGIIVTGNINFAFVRATVFARYIVGHTRPKVFFNGTLDLGWNAVYWVKHTTGGTCDWTFWFCRWGWNRRWRFNRFWRRRSSLLMRNFFVAERGGDVVDHAVGFS